VARTIRSAHTCFISSETQKELGWPFDQMHVKEFIKGLTYG